MPGLVLQGFTVKYAENVEEGLEYARSYEHDAILTSYEGFAKALRDAKVDAPVIVISDCANIVRELENGADDVLSPPLPSDEIFARIHAMVRRSQGLSHPVVTIDNMVLDLTTRMVTVNGLDVHLTGKEYQMLELLALRRGSVQTKERFLEYLYNTADREPETKIIDVYICKLRKKLADAKGPEIQTVWGRGYMLPGKHTESPSIAPELRELEPIPTYHFRESEPGTKRAKKAGQSA